MDKITNRSNPKIKAARELRQRKHREASANFLVEGIHHVGAAVEADAEFEHIFYAPQLLKGKFALEMIEQATDIGVHCYSTSSEVFTYLAEKENPQGILAVVRQPRKTLTDLDPENCSWGLACVSPQDPGNVGTIMRTIDAVGANGLLLIDGGVDAYHPTAVRASMGAIFRHQVVSASFPDFSNWVKQLGYHVYGTSALGSLDYREVTTYASPMILLLGSERQGLTADQMKICQDVIRLPMRGEVTSLNLAVAAGVLMYGMLEGMELGNNN
jgi:TrmH family RNA methyltransferase